jgi:tRNA(adenine34) deaminase
MALSAQDRDALRRAIELAHEAERHGNLPIGAVICLDGAIISEGMNAIWKPALDITRHAEMEALRAVPHALWIHSRDMTLYTTLEPCMMCAGALLQAQLGRVVFGAADPYGGSQLGQSPLAPFFQEQLGLVKWVGPVLADECDPLHQRIMALERGRHEAGLD